MASNATSITVGFEASPIDLPIGVSVDSLNFDSINVNGVAGRSVWVIPERGDTAEFFSLRFNDTIFKVVNPVFYRVQDTPAELDIEASSSIAGEFFDTLFIQELAPCDTLIKIPLHVIVLGANGIVQKNSQEAEIQSIRINPNPVSNGELQLECSRDFAPSRITVQLLDVLGRLVYSADIDGSSLHSNSGLKIDVTQLKSGSYIARILSGRSVASQKLIIQHQ